MTNKIELIDLKAQYADLKQSIDARIHRVLDHGQYIMGPEVRELEERLEAYKKLSIAYRVPPVLKPCL